MKPGPVLGIEGTAWNLSASVFDDDLISISSHPYKPVSGGIHPREAAQHHASEIKRVVETALLGVDSISGVAFSQGPGLGPCLRIIGTAARSLALSLGVPLIGVNHCVAHIEIGRFATGFDDPIVLYASGANTQVLGYLNGRYRIFGETLDIGLGNALDKFARSKGLTHPGGPKIEELGKSGSYVELPYTVKGMDLAFSGLMSAAKDAGAPLEDVCYSFQETAFAMCVEVAERALAQSGKDEMLLVGGVGANKRLQEMLNCMCEERGASFAVPDMKYLGDNGAMIAHTGRLMLEHEDTLSVPDSKVNPSFRADQVPVTWRTDAQERKNPALELLKTKNPVTTQGAEALVSINPDEVIKKRFSKSYRNPELDLRLIAERTRSEAKLISHARRSGVPTPIISDITYDAITMERVQGELMKHALNSANITEAGRIVGKLHQAGIVHGDLTTCNMIMQKKQCVLIDFGLAHNSSETEARGVDLHVLFQILESTSEQAETLKNAFCDGYCETFSYADEVIRREQEIELRGRYL